MDEIEKRAVDNLAIEHEKFIHSSKNLPQSQEDEEQK